MAKNHKIKYPNTRKAKVLFRKIVNQFSDEYVKEDAFPELEALIFTIHREENLLDANLVSELIDSLNPGQLPITSGEDFERLHIRELMHRAMPDYVVMAVTGKSEKVDDWCTENAFQVGFNQLINDSEVERTANYARVKLFGLESLSGPILLEPNFRIREVTRYELHDDLFSHPYYTKWDIYPSYLDSMYLAEYYSEESFSLTPNWLKEYQLDDIYMPEKKKTLTKLPNIETIPNLFSNLITVLRLLWDRPVSMIPPGIEMQTQLGTNVFPQLIIPVGHEYLSDPRYVTQGKSRMDWGNDDIIIEGSEISKLRRIFSKYNKMMGGNSHISFHRDLKRAIKKLDQSYIEDYIEDCVVDITTGLEAITRSSGQSLCFRIVCFNSANPDLQENLKNMQEFIELRNKYVHGSSIDSIKGGLVKYAREQLRHLILRSILWHLQYEIPPGNQGFRDLLDTFVSSCSQRMKMQRILPSWLRT